MGKPTRNEIDKALRSNNRLISHRPDANDTRTELEDKYMRLAEEYADLFGRLNEIQAELKRTKKELREEIDKHEQQSSPFEESKDKDKKEKRKTFRQTLKESNELAEVYQALQHPEELKKQGFTDKDIARMHADYEAKMEQNDKEVAEIESFAKNLINALKSFKPGRGRDMFTQGSDLFQQGKDIFS